VRDRFAADRDRNDGARPTGFLRRRRLAAHDEMRVEGIGRIVRAARAERRGAAPAADVERRARDEPPPVGRGDGERGHRAKAARDEERAHRRAGARGDERLSPPRRVAGAAVEQDPPCGVTKRRVGRAGRRARQRFERERRIRCARTLAVAAQKRVRALGGARKLAHERDDLAGRAFAARGQPRGLPRAPLGVVARRAERREPRRSQRGERDRGERHEPQRGFSTRRMWNRAHRRLPVSRVIDRST